MLLLLLAALAVKPILDRPPTITGNCHPARVHFTGHITADSPGPVKYTWVRSDKPSTAPSPSASPLRDLYPSLTTGFSRDRPTAGWCCK